MAKTTTVHSLGVASAELGRRTLVVDLDPQACLTYSLGFDPDALDRSLHDVFVRRDERGRRLAAGARRRRSSTCCRPPSTWPAPRSTCSPGPGASTCWSGPSSRSSIGTTSSSSTARPSLGRADHQRADRGQLGADPAAVRGPVPPRRRPAARDHRGRAGVRQQRARPCGASSPPCTTTAPGTRATSSRRCESRYGIPVLATAGAQVDPLRRGPGPGEVASSSTPRTRRGRWPTAQLARSPARARAWPPATSAKRRRPRPAGQAGALTGCPSTTRRPRTVAARASRRRSHADPPAAGRQHALFSAPTPAGEGDPAHSGGSRPTRFPARGIAHRRPAPRAAR